LDKLGCEVSFSVKGFARTSSAIGVITDPIAEVVASIVKGLRFDKPLPSPDARHGRQFV
jgi:hypothetical protein